MTNFPRKPNAGITLLEVLLALAVMSMLGVAMNGLFSTGGQVWSRIEENRTVPDQALARFELRRDMENMPVVTALLSLDSIFRLEPDGFAFVSDFDDIEGEPNWIQVRMGETGFSTRQDDIGNALRDAISDGRMTYYGRKSPRDAPAWHDDWTTAIILPQLIKIETWTIDGTVNPPLSIQPGKIARQSEISLSSLVPPD